MGGPPKSPSEVSQRSRWPRARVGFLDVERSLRRPHFTKLPIPRQSLVLLLALGDNLLDVVGHGRDGLGVHSRQGECGAGLYRLTAEVLGGQAGLGLLGLLQLEVVLCTARKEALTAAGKFDVLDANMNALGNDAVAVDLVDFHP